MTVICTVISRYCTAHASDSYITEPQDDGTRVVLEAKATKIVCVPQWAGILSYWGLNIPDNWPTLKWLRERAESAGQFDTPEAFAVDIAARLNKELSEIPLPRKDKGIGIHFTAYEECDGYKIPEMFAITNYTSTAYDKVFPDGVHVTRETFGAYVVHDSTRADHGKPYFRHCVREMLDAGLLMIFNNGDPVMFNHASNAMRALIEEARIRNLLRLPETTKAHREIAALPIRFVSQIQAGFLQEGQQRVGGDIHEMSATPAGQYESDSDPCPPSPSAQPAQQF